MKFLKTNILLVLAILIGANTSSFSQSPEQIYQKGLMKEEGEGALLAAIDLYDQVADNSNVNKSLRAKALLHIGMCYEKLGNQEAVNAYQRLVNNFPGQKGEVAIARERLSRLIHVYKEPLEEAQVKTAAAQLTNKKIWGEDKDIDDSGEISPNGKFLSYIDWSTGDLAVYEITTGNKRKLTNIGQGSNYHQYAYSPIWSNDGSRIYYAYFVSPNLSEIRTIGLNNSQPQTICKIKEPGKWLQIRDLSSDGKSILATLESQNSTEIIIAPISDTTYQLIKELSTPHADHPTFTKDGKAIVYDYLQNTDSKDHDIFLLTIADKKIIPLISHSAHDVLLDLSPDGKQILFTSNRSGISAIWSIDFHNGKKVDNPTLVKSNENGNLAGLGFSKNGSFYYFYLPSKSDVYQIEINPTTGDVVVPPTEAVGKFVGINSTPDYSSDGKYLAFISQRAPFTSEAFRPIGNTLCIKSMKDGSIREVKPDISNFGFPKWASDNRSVIVVNWDADENMELYDINIESGKASLIYSGDPQSFGSHDLGLNGKSVYMVNKADGDIHKLIKYNPSTKTETIITEGTWKELTNISCSPDGKWISFLGRDQNRSLKIIPAEGGETRELHSWTQGDNRAIFHCWSADSKYIYVPKMLEPKEEMIWDIWQIPVDGSEPKNLGLELTQIWQISAHPNGTHLAYSNQGSTNAMPEVWVMENFLHSDKEETEAVKEPEGIIIKQISKEPYLDDLGTVSSDGRFRSTVDWGNGDLAIINLINGEKRILTNSATLEDPQKFVIGSAISKNGKQVAYSWWRPNHTYELHIIDVDNPSTRLLFKQESVEVYPVTWLSDEELITIMQDRRNETTKITSLNVSDGSLKDLKFFDSRKWMQLTTSPDEKFIAYNFVHESDNENIDINLIEVDGGNEISLIKHPANDKVIGWIPGRKEFLFISDRSGTWDLWAIPFIEVKPSGQAKRIYTDIGEVGPMGITKNGDCYFGFSRRNFNNYITPFNMETGKVLERSGKSLPGSNFQTRWSPDGQYLAYIKEDAKTDNPWQLTIQDLNTGIERKLGNTLFMASDPHWSPEGNSIMVIGGDKLPDKNYKGGIYQVDFKSGITKEILLLSDYQYNMPVDDAYPLSRIEWSLDGEHIFYLFFKDRLVKHNLKNGVDKTLYTDSNFNFGLLDRSPDGKNLLFAIYRPEEKKSYLYSMSVEGENIKEVCPSQEVERFYGAFWSPDGKYIYFTEKSDGTSLWKISAEGRIPQKVWQSEKRLEFLSIPPDGSQIAFSIRERTTEIRMITGLIKELEKMFRLDE